jgi:hypothetical protein
MTRKGVVLIMPEPFDLETLIAAVEGLTRSYRPTPHTRVGSEDE